MKKILNLMRENLNAQITALASATGKEVEALRAGLQAQLGSLAELDKLPETDANAAFLGLLSQQHEHNARLFTELQTARTALTEANGKVTEFNTKLANGELVTKAVHTEKCGLAKDEGVATCQPEIAALRKQVVNGLPVPPENVLKLPATEFNAAIENARANLTEAGKKGLALDGKGKQFLGRALWLAKDVFATELASLEADFPNLLGKADPFKAGGKDEEEATPRKPRLGMC